MKKLYSCKHPLQFKHALPASGIAFFMAFLAVETANAEQSKAPLSLEMFATGMLDNQGKPLVQKGATQSVGPISLQLERSKADADGKKTLPDDNSLPVSVTFELDNQQYIHYSLPAGQAGEQYGVEFGQAGPYSSDAIKQYAKIGDFVSEKGGDLAKVVGPESVYTTRLLDEGANSGSGLTLQNEVATVAYPNYAVQLAVYSHPLLGKLAGSYRMADLIIHFDRPVTNPILHFHKLGAVIPSGAISSSFYLESTDSASGATLKKLTGSEQRLEVKDDWVKNSNPGLDCSAPAQKPGAACGSVEVKGENIQKIKLVVYLSSQTTLNDPKDNGLKGVDLLGLSVSIPEPLPVPLWEGFYGGVLAGVVLNQSQINAQGFGIEQSPLSHNIDSTSFMPGIDIGYVHQYKSGWVSGVELDLNFPYSSGSALVPCLTCSSWDKYTVKSTIQGDLLGRIGHEYNRLLPYITGGVSLMGASLNYSNSTPDSYNKNSVLLGWVVGTGLEYRPIDKFSVRAEYLYTDYGNHLGLATPNSSAPGLPWNTINSDFVTHTARIALNYWF